MRQDKRDGVPIRLSVVPARGRQGMACKPGARGRPKRDGQP